MNESNTYSFCAGGGVRSSVFEFCSLMCYPLDFKGADYESVVKFTKDVQPRVVLARFTLH